MNKSATYNLILFSILMLTAVGVVMVYSASASMAAVKYHNPMRFFARQMIWLIPGFLSFMFFKKFDYNRLKNYIPAILIGTGLILIAVLINAPDINGARRWIRLGMLSFQPSELAKLSAIIFLAGYISDWHKKMKNIKTGLVNPFFIIGPILLLIFAEKDFGIPAIIFATTLILLYTGGTKLKHILYIILPIVPFAVYVILKNAYRVNRLLIFLNPWSDPNGNGYQIIQSLSAFGDGGLIGCGLGKSKINNLFLPESHTDFIFPIIGNETGYVGTMLILLFFVILFYSGLQISKNAKNVFGSILALGITLSISFQAMINMGVSVALLPNKGLPLPFISSGGSSLLVSLTCIGILLNICQQIEK